MRYGSVARRLMAIAALTSLFFLTTTSAGTNSWTINGPPGGFFRMMQTSASSPDTTYGVFNRSLFRSTDHGVSWQLVRDVDGQVNDLAIDPSDANRVYLAVADEGVLRIDVAAQTSTALTPAWPWPWSVAVSTDGTTLYYGAMDGSFNRSLDRGQTWQQQTKPGLGSVTRILVDRDDSQLVHIAHNGVQIARSADGGANWTNTPIPGVTMGTIYAFAKLPGSTTLVASTSQELYVSTDDGQNWSLRLSGWIWDVQVDPSQPASFLATPSSQINLQRFYRSTDSGSTWSQFGTPPSFGARAIVTSGTALIMAGDQGVQHSTDNGMTWTEASPAPVASSPSLATTVAANSKVYAYASGAYIGSTNGLFSTANDGEWERLNIRAAQALGSEFGQASIAVKPGDPETVYLYAYSQGIFRSTDGGHSWERFGFELNGMGSAPLVFDPLDSDIMYTTVLRPSPAPAALVYRSTNGGRNWSPHSDGSMPINVIPTSMAVDPADGDRMFMTVIQGFGPPGSGGLYRSTDGGVQWTLAAFPGGEVRDVTVNPADSSIVYAINGLGLHVSTDGGTTFVRNLSSATIANQPGSAIVVDPSVPSTLYYATTDQSTPQNESSYVLRSVDGGTTWETLRDRNATSTWLVNDLLLDPNNPSLLYAQTGLRGVATMEISPDVSVRIDGHSGIRPVGLPSTFDLHAENAGPYAATAIQLVTTLPAGLTEVSATIDRGTCAVSETTLTCSIPFLRTGESVTARVTYTPAAATLLAIAATLSLHERDNAEANNTASASALAGKVVDLGVSVTAPATVDHGDSLTFTANVTNSGPRDAASASLLFVPGTGLTLGAAPAGCSAVSEGFNCAIDSIAAGASQSFSFQATASGIGPLSVSTTASPSAIAVDVNTANNNVVTPVTSRAVGDLAVTVTDSADPVNTGTGFEYRIAVHNNGPDDAPSVVAAITAPGLVSISSPTQGTCATSGGLQCTLGTIASGATVTITVSTSVATAGTVSLSASVSSAGTDRVSANNSAQESTQVNAPPQSGGGGGGGGGGSVDLWLVLSLLTMLAALRISWRHGYRRV